MRVKTNIEGLDSHLRDVFNNLLDNEHVRESAINASSYMGHNVYMNLRASQYSYSKSGEFLALIQEELQGKGKPYHKEGNRLIVGFGDLERMGKSTGAKRGDEKQYFTGMTVDLQEEKQLPKWILLEFGTRGKSDPTSTIPNSFFVPYSRDSSKSFLYGTDSDFAYTGHRNGMSTSGAHFMGHKGNGAFNFNHRGTEPGRFFRDGLIDSKDYVARQIGSGIKAYLRNR